MGVVYLIGAGPGDPGLITARGAELLAAADVVIYDGLVGDGLLERVRPDAEHIYAGKKRSGDRAPLTQDQINDLMIERARAGAAVARLKGGDPFIFGRAAEELEALVAAGVPFELVPGVSSLSAVPAYAGILVTQRGVASSVAIATGHAAGGGQPEPPLDWRALASAHTSVLFMALRTAGECAAHMIDAGADPQTPAAAIYWGTTASQRVVTSTLGELGEAVVAAGLKPPVLIVTGDVAGEARRFSWRARLPLGDARVLVPRPRGRAGAFAAAVTRLGAEALCAPFTRIVPAAVTSDAFARAGDFDWVLFSSATAVEHAIAALVDAGSDVRQLATARIGCVGESTARALARVGIRADLVPERRSSAGLADALLASIAGHPADFPRVLVCRAEHGRDDAERTLRDSQCEVEVAELYRSAPADPSEPAIARALRRARAGHIDVVAFFAPSQVRAYAALLGEAPRPRLVAAIGKTTAAAVEAAGLGPVDVIASRPDPDQFAAEIAERWGQ